jgi:hypothetical protein
LDIQPPNARLRPRAGGAIFIFFQQTRCFVDAGLPRARRYSRRRRNRRLDNANNWSEKTSRIGLIFFTVVHPKVDSERVPLVGGIEPVGQLAQ